MKNKVLCTSLLVTLALSACSDLPEWLGGAEEKEKLEGKRIAVLSDVAELKPDASIAELAVTVPEAQANAAWEQQGGSPAGITGNLTLSGLKHDDSASVGDGNGWDEYSNMSPVVSGGLVFAMDAKGFVSAHDAMHISNTRWMSKSLVEEDEPDVMGGGLAVDGGRLFLTSGYGKVAALDAATGKELWKVALGTPLRNAPKASGGKLFVLTADNQLFVLDALKGTQLWSHRGITENVGFITSAAPTAKDALVLAPYSSGVIHALDAASGQEVWNDTLILSRRTTATGGFSGIGGAPVIADDTVYAGDSGGFFAAITLLSGRRVWEQDIPTLNAAWIAGEYVYLLSESAQLSCLLRADGRVKWTQQLPRYENEAKRKDAYVWYGPVMAGGQLLVAGQHGVMLALSPKDGATVSSIDIDDKITNSPVVAGGRIYYMTRDARLHSIY